jgi:hypothetical protein
MRSVVEEFGEFVLSWRIGVEDKGAVGVEGDFPGFPGFEGFPKLALVRVEVRRPVRDLEFELRGIGFFGFPPAPFGLGTDGFEGLDVERRAGRWGYREEAFPETVEAEEEFDFFGAQDFAGDLHGGFALGAEEGIFSPDAQDEVAPERAKLAVGFGSGGYGDWRSDSGLAAAGAGLKRWQKRVAFLFEAAESV